MASGFVFVDDVFISHAINDAGRFLEHVVSDGFVASRDGLTYAFDRRTQHLTQRGVVFVAFYRLAGAFTSLCSVSHNLLRSVRDGCQTLW